MAWIDHVVRSGRIFESTNGQYRGMLTGKVATLVAVSCGVSAIDEGDHQIR
jgi:FMN-dependent NADH-azoreductase